MRRSVFRISPSHPRCSRLPGAALIAVMLSCTGGEESPTAPDGRPTLAATSAVPLVFRQITAGDGHTCGLTTAGVAYCWGSNESGQLGIDAEAAAAGCVRRVCSTPVRVAGGHGFRQLSAWSSHTCGVTRTHRLYCWGHNHTGQLGDGTYADRPRPIQIAPGLSFRQVSTGALHTCAVTTSDVAYCWGHNQAGPLGTGTVFWATSPVRVARRLPFREISAGYQFTCAVTTDDRAFCWGLNADGQLGVGNADGPELCFTGDGYQACATSPVPVTGRLAVRQLTADGSHACAVTRDDDAFCWGSNSVGELGWGSPAGPELCSPISPCSTRPVRVSGGLAFATLSRNCGITRRHAAYCWGANFFGELGTGSATGPETCPALEVSCSTRPVPVIGERLYRDVSGSGGSHACAVTLAGRAFCWGDNEFGQLGDGTTTDHAAPKPVERGQAI